MKKRWIEPVTLIGAKVILEPLSLEHLEGVQAAVKDGCSFVKQTGFFIFLRQVLYFLQVLTVHYLRRTAGENNLKVMPTQPPYSLQDMLPAR